MSIECVHLHKSYGSKEIIKDVSVTIREGVITGLIGPNGAGKSTLIKLITGLVYPSSGNVYIDGYDSSAEHLEAMNRLGAIVEWPSFYPDLTARRNLAILSGGRGKKYEQKLEEVTDFLGISHVLDRKVNIFSTGMKQRLGIALAMLPDSKYIILDEPANGLDPAGIVEIRNLICECKERAGVTVLVSSHLLSEMELICDDVVMIVDGKVRAAGQLDELLRNSNRYRVVTTDNKACYSFLKSAEHVGAYGISQVSEVTDEGTSFIISPEAAPETVTTELFKRGLGIQHFARENNTLEEFFISKSSAGGK